MEFNINSKEIQKFNGDAHRSKKNLCGDHVILENIFELTKYISRTKA